MATARPTWEGILADARTRGFVTVSEMAEELGIKWDHVLTWIDKAGVELVDLLPAGAKAYRHLAAKRKTLGIAGRCGVYAPDDEAVEAAYQEWIDQIEAENAAANAAAEAEYQRLLQEQVARKAAQDRARLDYEEWSRTERVKAEEERQARLAASRATERRRIDLDAAQADVWNLRPKARLAQEQFESTASAEARTAFWNSRLGTQNFEYASTNRGIGRQWAKGVADRYESALLRAEEVLAGVSAGRHPYPWQGENLAVLEAGGYIWETDNSHIESRAQLIREAFKTYEGPFNRRGVPRLRPFREHAKMEDITRAEIRQAQNP